MTTIKSVFEYSPQTLLVETGKHEGETYLRINNGKSPMGDAMVATADLLAALDAVPRAEVVNELREARAERDALAATVERVREAAAIWGEGFRAAVLAAIDPEPFTLPTEAGVKFYAEDPEGDSFVFKTLIGGRETLYIADDDQDQVCNADELAEWQNFRLLPAADEDGGDE